VLRDQNTMSVATIIFTNTMRASMRELSVSNRAAHEISINTMSVARSQTPVQAAQSPSTWQKSPSVRQKNKGDESS
jgi:hypothetical protein